MEFQKTKNSSSDASFSMISWEEVMSREAVAELIITRHWGRDVLSLFFVNILFILKLLSFLYSQCFYMFIVSIESFSSSWLKTRDFARGNVTELYASRSGGEVLLQNVVNVSMPPLLPPVNSNTLGANTVLFFSVDCFRSLRITAAVSKSHAVFRI